MAEDHDHVYSLCWHGGDLYVGLQGHFSGFKGDRRESRDAVERLDPAPDVHGDGAIYRLAGETWSRVAGNGIAGSWETALPISGVAGGSTPGADRIRSLRRRLQPAVTGSHSSATP